MGMASRKVKSKSINYRCKFSIPSPKKQSSSLHKKLNAKCEFVIDQIIGNNQDEFNPDDFYNTEKKNLNINLRDI